MACLSLLYYYCRFFFNRDMGQIRSALACTILLYSIKYLKEKKLGKFLFIIIIASLFHSAAIIFVICYPVYSYFYNKELTIKNVLLPVSLSILLSFIINPLLMYIVRFFPSYANYVISDYYTRGGGLKNPIILMQVLILISFIVFSSDRLKNNKYIKTAFIVYLVGTIILVSFNQYPTLAGRASTLFSSTEILLVPLIFNKFFNRYVRWLLVLVISIFIFYLIFIYSNLYIHFVPYNYN